ncbi:MAG TPA: hypothetical protein VK277_02420 [Acidimicrobiales bacterium]|nr:hypothetical protein [Acidimicrobiales bacterium]
MSVQVTTFAPDAGQALGQPDRARKSDTTRTRMGPVTRTFRVNERDIDWVAFKDGGGTIADGVRFKALTRGEEGVPPMQFVSYPPGHSDPPHEHETGEVMVVVSGSVNLDGVESGPGSVLFVAKETTYALVAGDEGAVFYRIVTD